MYLKITVFQKKAYSILLIQATLYKIVPNT